MAIRQILSQLVEAYSIIIKENINYEGISPTQILITNDGQTKLSLSLARLLSDPQ